MAPKKQDYASTNSPDDDLIPASLECSYSVDQKFVLYPRRWIVLASFFLLSMSNSWMWITWSPLAEKAARFWDVSIDAVDGLSAVYMYIYVPFSFVSLHLVVHRLGLRGGLLASSILNGIGAIVRCACVASYRWVYLGTVIAALAQTFTLSAPPLLSANWFPDSERATATSIGVLANQLGITIGRYVLVHPNNNTGTFLTNFCRLTPILFFETEPTKRTGSYQFHCLRWWCRCQQQHHA